MPKAKDKAKAEVNYKWYVVEDDEGFWLTQTPSATDNIVHGPIPKDVAEQRLGQEIARMG